jgi:two-component system sensor histidine kinase AlgZ
MYQTGFFQDFLAYWVVLCLQYASKYHLKYREQERLAAQLQIDEEDLRAQLFSAELTNLRRQLQPELVFHTLDTTAALVSDDQHGRAEDLLAALGDLLRCALDDPPTRAVSLSRELEHVRAYLALEQLRLGTRVLSHLVTDPATRDAAMLPASIQPIVRHAVESIVDDLNAVCSITIRSARVGDLLKVEIECSARTQLADKRFPDLEPILENTRARLGQVYSADFRLGATDRGLATVVTLLLPYEMVKESPHSLSHEPAQVGLFE